MRRHTVRRIGQAAAAFSLLTGLVTVTHTPASAAVRTDATTTRMLAALTTATAPDWDDDEYDWYRQTLVDIAGYDTEPEVRTAAQAALDVGTMAAVKAFVDTGWAAARAQANSRKSKNLKTVQGWAKTGGPKVKEYANRALVSGDYAISEFVAWGHEAADLLDHPVTDTQAEQDRIRGRVEQMVTFGGPTVVADGTAALATGDPAVIATFYRTGYSVAAQSDYDIRESIRVAVENRNTALDAITAQARLNATAASARAEILHANIEAMKLLDDALIAMQSGVAASRRADQILEEDKVNRKNGQKGRTTELQALVAEATGYTQRATVAATQADSTVATAQTAASKLIGTGQSHGVDWAKVTVGAGSAIQAATATAETAQHAAEATLADSLALDADANAQLHANNAAKWLAAAQKQAAIAKNLAAVAVEQQKIAEAAAGRAKAQRLIAEAASVRAGQHAANARNARISAQAASGNAIGKSNDAILAHTNAQAAAERENAAISKARQAGDELETATNRCFAAQEAYQQITAALQTARDEATAAGKDADVATADLAAAANQARDAYNASQAWADRARAAAATAQAEAQQASAAASQARSAAAKADQDALTARRASDKAQTVARGAINAAQTARLDAQRTQTEASAAVQESTQAVFDADVADQAAGAAAASAEVAVDKADSADWVAAQFSGVDADARRIMQVTSLAVTDSQERQAAARTRADEAAAAADRATDAANRAVGDIKPAYDAAAQAVKSANDAAKAADAAHDAAVDAINQANGANRAAAQASQYEQSAWGDASVADAAAQTAQNAANIANTAAKDAEGLHTWATTQTANLHAFATELGNKLKDIKDEKARQDTIEAKKHELEDKVADGIVDFYQCHQKASTEDCQKIWDFAKEKGQELADTGWNYVKNAALCRAGIQSACDAATDANESVLKFVQQVGVGVWESLKSTWAAVKMLGSCMSWVFVGTDDPDFQENCGKAVAAFQAMPAMLRDHPLELIHISEWQDNPGKAFGMTLFDVGTFFIPGVGEITGALNKLLAGLGVLLPKTLARLAEGVGVIDRFVVPLAEGGSKFPGGLAKLTNVVVKIENGAATIIDGIAIVDGTAFKLEAGALKLTGAVEDMVSGMVRLEGGVVRVEGKTAKLDDAVVRVEKGDTAAPKVCGLGLRAMAAAAAEPCLGDQPDGSWVGEEFDKPLTLEKPFNDAANDAIKAAKAAEPSISKGIENATARIPGATKGGWDYRLKQPDSLKRKIIGDHRKAPAATPAEIVGAIRDNIRYTWIFDDEQYLDRTLAGISELRRQGFQLQSFSNSWLDTTKTYMGINTKWLDPKTGSYFEMQFHTPDSFQINKREHSVYEQIRNPETTAEQKAALQRISEQMWGVVTMPAGTDLLTEDLVRQFLGSVTS